MIKDIILQHIEKVKNISATTKEEIENARIEYLGKKGVMNDLFAKFKEVAPEERKEIGILLNELKNTVQNKIDTLKETIAEQQEALQPKEDFTKPANAVSLGSIHPLTTVRKEIIDIFSRIGFTVAEGPEIEDDWHVFSALNFPPEHPARDMQDTFFVENGREDGNDVLLRTHTSSVQVRTMERQQPPIRIIAPGRVFRNEAISARAHCIFHQIEGLYIDKNVSFADLKQSLLYFVKEMFGTDTKIRLRPSYFPFTEPSAEMDISCTICKGEGCNICKHTGWLEILGCGMVDPNVLEASGIDSKVYSGFAFGMGVERIAMLKYDVKDLRQYFENDIRFLNQFAGVI
ncbi:MAG: phenylalanine--tRNA ligase subunit alpha [Bacteroidales bacterium]|nr:phenylalanine--tRNA ligase subunit alpha [Bacteroidales bacterium]